MRLTRVGFGPEHPRTWFAELSMARHQTRLGRPQEALAALETLARHEGSGSEAPKLRWLARGYQAEARCRMGERERAQRDLDALAVGLRAARGLPLRRLTPGAARAAGDRGVPRRGRSS